MRGSDDPNGRLGLSMCMKNGINWAFGDTFRGTEEHKHGAGQRRYVEGMWTCNVHSHMEGLRGHYGLGHCRQVQEMDEARNWREEVEYQGNSNHDAEEVRLHSVCWPGI